MQLTGLSSLYESLRLLENDYQVANRIGCVFASSFARLSGQANLDCIIMIGYHEIMKQLHGRKPARVAEPVQVYLEPTDRARLDRMAEDMNATKSDVLRRALEALEQQLTDPDSHPAMRLIGMAGPHTRHPPPGTHDVAVEHDSYLAEQEIASWQKPRPRKRGS